MKRYLKRVCDQTLALRLESKGAVLIEGPKWCGKTTTASRQAGSIVYMQDPKSKQQNMRLAQIAPSVLLEGETPRLIDEWQIAPQLWDAIRFEVDQRDVFGQFMLTGSSVPADMDETQHTGTGRISRMRMRPMSLMESEDSSGAVSLRRLFEGDALPVVKADCDIARVAFLCCRGGWPKAIGCSERIALQQAIDYVDAVAEVDISKVDGVKRNPRLARLLMRSYARMVASQGTYVKMRADMKEGGAPISEITFAGYSDALEKLFVIEDLDAWNPNLRSKVAIRNSPTRHFVDPSIAATALGASPGELVNDLETLGLIFESLCIRDLRVYAEALDGTLCHYRDRSGLEADAVIRLRNGSYALVEVKLGGDRLIEEGASSLKSLAARIDTTKMKKPSFLAVVTGVGEYSYPREDGVLVIPITALGA